MSTIVVSGDTSGSITLAAPAVAGTNTITMPAQTGNMMVNGPAFSVYLNANQSISSATPTKVNFNTELFDTANCFNSSSTYRFTPNIAGYYQFNWYVQTVNSTNTLISYLVKNGDNNGPIGSAWRGSRVDVTGTTVSNGSSLVYLNGSTDYVEVFGYIGSASAGFYGSTLYSDACYFNGFLARGA